MRPPVAAPLTAPALAASVAAVSSSESEQQRSGSRSLRWVLGGVTAVGLLMTLAMHRAYTRGEEVVRAALPAFDEKGKSLDAEGCIDEVIAWHKTCDATSIMCNKGVLPAMYHCLKAQDRAADCAKLPETEGMDGKWVFVTCKERGTQCKRTKECACAEAYRAIDSFCRTDQKAVQL